MIKTQHPWQTGPTELIEFALERMQKGSDFDRHLAFLILDVGVETLIKTFLTLPDSITGVRTSFSARSTAVRGSFHALIQGLTESIPDRAQKIDLTHAQYYHEIRNTLYHEGSTVTTVSHNQLKGYASLAVDLLKELLNVDLSESLILVAPGTITEDDSVVDSVEVKVSFGRFRLDRLKSNKIRAFSLNNNTLKSPVKPFLRAVVEELSLPVEFTTESGTKKNTQALGKDVIHELKTSAWHGWVAGQKVRKDTLVSALTGRILDGKVDEQNWAIVEFVRNLKDEMLVYQPVGRGLGNSPFNMNCWYTENGDPIKQ